MCKCFDEVAIVQKQGTAGEKGQGALVKLNREDAFLLGNFTGILHLKMAVFPCHPILHCNSPVLIPVNDLKKWDQYRDRYWDCYRDRLFHQYPYREHYRKN